MLESDVPLAIALRGVTVRFGERTALSDINLEILAGQRVALVGPSGCGKTTLLRVLSGSIPPCGTVVRQGRVGVVYQDLKLLSWLRVQDNIFIGRNSIPEADTELVRRWITIAGLSDKLAHYPYQLSGGQKQRAAIIRALVQKPDILLLDEPFSAIDFIAKRRLIRLIDSIGDLANLTIVIVSHDLDDALSLGDRILVMNEGRLVADLENPSHSTADLSELQTEIRSMFGKEVQS